jgi:rare lipoprotein A
MQILSSRRGRTRVTRARHLTLPAIALAALAALPASIFILGATITEAKTPGSTYCFYGKCHRVKSITETESLVGQDVTLSASFYDSCKKDRYNPCGLTSSGEVFRPEQPDNAASPIYPDGTKLLVWSPVTGEAVVVRVNNAGPYWGNRKLDVSRAAAERLGFKGQGVAQLKVRVIDAPGKEEATYRKNRKYEPVPGYIGKYASLDEASTAMAAMMAVDALATTVKTPAPKVAAAAARAELVAKSKPSYVAKAKPKTVANKTVAKATSQPLSAEIPIPVIKEIIQLTETVFGIQQPTRPKAVAARKVPRPVAVAKRPTRAKPTAQQLAAAKQRRLAKAKKSTAVAAVRKPPPKPSPVADAPNDMSIFSRHAKDRIGSKPQRQAEDVARGNRRPS